MISIPSTVETIGKNAFSKLRKLTEITLPSSTLNADGCAFEKCN